MKSNLRLLLDHLHAEYELLERELNECIQYRDFKGAEAYEKALSYTRSRLQVLQNLDNPLYDNISDLQSRIERLQKPEVVTASPNPSESTMFMLNHMLEISKSELAKMQAINHQSSPDDDELLLHLEALLTRTLPFFELYSDPVMIIFATTKDQLEITINGLNHHSISPSTKQQYIRELRSMNFEIMHSSAILQIGQPDISALSYIHQLIARIIYDVFRLYGNKEASIRVEGAKP